MAFNGHLIYDNNIALLCQVIKAAIEPALVNHNDYDDHLEESDNDEDIYETDMIDQIGQNTEQESETDESSQDNAVEANADVIQEQAEFDTWMEKIMIQNEQDYLREEEEKYKGEDDGESSSRSSTESLQQERTRRGITAASTGSRLDTEAEDSCDDASDISQDVRELPVCKNSSSSGSSPSSTSSDDTLHSVDSLERRNHNNNKESQPHFQSPEPYQVRKSLHSTSMHEASQQEQPESLPAWLMPKSPLDEHFRKGYGGLGKDDLQDVIAEVTTSQKKALRASRIQDDNESTSSSAYSSSRDTGNDSPPLSARRQEEEDSLPAWLMPKSPLDEHFRKGYGGLGKEDLSETIEVINTAQKKQRDATARAMENSNLCRERLYSDSDTDVVDRQDSSSGVESGGMESEFDFIAENVITVDDLPDDFGSEPTPLNPTTVGTPVQARSSRSNNGSTGSSGQQPQVRSVEYAKQTKLFQSPNPSQIRVAVTSKTPKSEDPIPAWLMPKSPLDEHFRKGYGGLGKEDLSETIEVINTAQKKQRNAAACDDLLWLHSHSGDSVEDRDEDSIIKDLDAYYDAKRNKTVTSNNHGMNKTTTKKNIQEKNHSSTLKSSTNFVKNNIIKTTLSRPELKTQPSRTNTMKSTKRITGKTSKISKKSKKTLKEIQNGPTSEQIMFDPINMEDDTSVNSLLNNNNNSDDLLPSAHPSISVPINSNGEVLLTKNASLNQMIQESFRNFVAQYSKKGQLDEFTKAMESGMNEEIKHEKKIKSSPKLKTSKSTTLPSSNKKSNKKHVDDVNLYLQSPELKCNIEEIDEMIRLNLSKLTKMQKKEKELRESFSSALTLSDDENEEEGKQKYITRNTKKHINKQPKLTKRSNNYLIAPPHTTTAMNNTIPVKSSPGHPVKRMVHSKSQTSLHLRSTGNTRSTTPTLTRSSTPTSTVPSRTPTGVPKSFSSKFQTGSSNVLGTTASFAAKRAVSPAVLSQRRHSTTTNTTSSTSALNTQPSPRTSTTIPTTLPTTSTTTAIPLYTRPLSATSRLLAPTTASIHRTTETITKNSKTDNLHNEWHLHLRSTDSTTKQLDAHPSGKKIVRRSLPTNFLHSHMNTSIYSQGKCNTTVYTTVYW